MTDKQFIERIIFLTEKICDIYYSKTIDQNALDEVRSEIHEASGARESSETQDPAGYENDF